MRIIDIISTLWWIMTHKIKARLEWVKLYEETRNSGFVCRRCGISWPTLRTWWGRFQKIGEAGLIELSRRSHHSPNRKVLAKEIGWISELRKRRLGSRRIQSELLRNYAFSVSRATLCKVLRQLNVRGSRKVEFCENIGIATSVRFRASGFQSTLVKSRPVFGDAYTFIELKGMFEAAGFSQNEHIPLDPLPQHLVISMNIVIEDSK